MSELTLSRTTNGVAAEYRVEESRGIFVHQLMLCHCPECANKHRLHIFRIGARSRRRSGCFGTLDYVLRLIETGSPELLEHVPLIKRPEALVALIAEYGGLTAHEKLRALKVAQRLPEAIAQARRRKKAEKTGLSSPRPG